MAERLAEAELARLRTASGAKTPRVAERYREMLGRLNTALAQDPERARAALQTVIGESVTLQPDKSGKFLWAEYEMQTAALLNVAGGGKSEIMVAAASFVCRFRPIELRNDHSRYPKCSKRHGCEQA